MPREHAHRQHRSPATADPLVLESRIESARDRFRFRTRRGVHGHDDFRPGELLAVEHLWDRDPGRLRVVQATYGVVGVVLAERASAVQLTESSARAAALCEENAAANGVEATVELVANLTTLRGDYDTAVYVPKPYVPLDRGCQRIVDALAGLRPGGDLYVAARPRTGLSRYEQCLDDATVESTRVASGGEWTLLRGTRPREFEPRTCAEPRTVTATVGGVTLSLVTAPGLFAAGGLDDGTRLLGETVDLAAGAAVLDLCCGYGPLGTYAGVAAGADVWLSDDDKLATNCAERTLDRNDVTGRVHTADGVDAVRDRSFDRVLCNPPTHAGESVIAALFAGAADVLRPGGTLSLVHHRSLDLDRLLDPFQRVEPVATGTEHVVLEAVAAD